MRIDKWLWSMRLYKTRSLASEACKKKHVFINDTLAKSSRVLTENDIVIVKKVPINYSYKVQGLPKSRVSAKLVPD